jgi:hypothetical protein
MADVMFAKNQMRCTRQQLQRSKHSRAFAFGRQKQADKFKPSALRVVVDSVCLWC